MAEEKIDYIYAWLDESATSNDAIQPFSNHFPDQQETPDIADRAFKSTLPFPNHSHSYRDSPCENCKILRDENDALRSQLSQSQQKKNDLAIALLYAASKSQILKDHAGFQELEQVDLLDTIIKSNDSTQIAESTACDEAQLEGPVSDGKELGISKQKSGSARTPGGQKIDLIDLYSDS